MKWLSQYVLVPVAEKPDRLSGELAGSDVKFLQSSPRVRINDHSTVPRRLTKSTEWNIEVKEGEG